MTLAYAADALILEDDCLALRSDFDPVLHQVDIAHAATFFTDGGVAGWNDPQDPSIAHVRDLHGVPILSGHVLVSARFRLSGPDEKTVRIAMIEIDGIAVGACADARLGCGIRYQVQTSGLARAQPGPPETASGFGPGTMIATPCGACPVEWLAEGDAVLTLTGPKPVQAIGVQRISAWKMARNRDLRPLRLGVGPFGRFGTGIDLDVAPDTRILMSGGDLELHFGLDQALARAGDLMAPGDTTRPIGSATYFTVEFTQPQVFCANGIWCESRRGEGFAHDVKGPYQNRGQGADLPVLRSWECRMLSQLARPLPLSVRDVAA